MSQGSSGHDQNYQDLVCLHALHALPSSEIPAVEGHIAACRECQQDMQTLRPIVGVFVDWPTDVLRPSSTLWDRLAQRIAAETGQEPVMPVSQRETEPEWEETAPGVFVKVLAKDTETDRVSMLVRLSPGAAYPPHRHAGVEELYLLDGELIIDDKRLHPGDYNRGEPGATDHLVYSETGCTCVLITSIRDVLH